MFAELLFAVALTAAPADVAPVQPVTLEYEVFRNDKPMGRSTIQLSEGAGGTWTLETNTEGTSGLAGLAGAGIAERSEFAWRDGHPELRHYRYAQTVAWRNKNRVLDVLPQTQETTDRVEVAMLLVDIVRSTRLVLDLGDTNFVDHLHGLRSALRSSPALRFLKGTGDGYLAVFATTTRALAAARSLRAELRDPTHLRLVIHTGPVRLGDQDVFGSEVHRLFRIEALEQSDRADTSNSAPLQPGRITLSRPALAALPEPERAAFARAGSFRLKGFDEPEEVWVESEDIVAHPGE